MLQKPCRLQFRRKTFQGQRQEVSIQLREKNETAKGAEFSSTVEPSKLSLVDTVAVFQNSTLVRSSFFEIHFAAEVRSTGKTEADLLRAKQEFGIQNRKEQRSSTGRRIQLGRGLDVAEFG